MSSSKNYVSADTLRGTGIAMVAVASLFMAARCVARWYRVWLFQMEDLFMLLAYAFFLSMSISYLAIIAKLYRVTGVSEGLTPPYPAILKDSLTLIKVFFTNSMLLWFTLWSVKFSLLFLYRRLMMGLPKHLRWWWAVLAFCVVTLIGAVISNFTSCSSMHAWFTPGLCNTHRDAVAQIASLYYAFATDVVSDIMIMILPLRMIWNLQIPRAQKQSIAGIFCIGVICIIGAIVRVVQIGVKSGSDSTPSSSWLALWAMIEAAIAIIIGCLPSFTILYRSSVNSHRGFLQTYFNANTHSIAHPHGKDMPLSNTSNASRATPHGGDGATWEGHNTVISSSQEELAKPGQISVTRSVVIEFEPEHEQGH